MPVRFIKEFMANLNIFVSFEFDKDRGLENDFFAQAREKLPHRVRNTSLNEAYPNEEWMAKAQSAIRRRDLVIVPVGQETPVYSRGQDGSRNSQWTGEASLPSDTSEADV